MKKELWSFSVGMSIAIAAAIAGIPTACGQDSATSSDAEEKALAVGESAPAWTDLIGVDDQKHSLADLAEAKAVAVVFTCNHCPVAKAYENRIIELSTDCRDRGVELVAINVNNLEADKLPAMKVRAAEKGFTFDYLYDPSQQIGRDYGATVTPHVFLLDGQRNIAYVGAIDDSMNPENVTEHYLRDAIDAVLVGSLPSTTSTKPVGCGIKYE